MRLWQSCSLSTPAESARMRLLIKLASRALMETRAANDWTLRRLARFPT